MNRNLAEKIKRCIDLDNIYISSDKRHPTIEDSEAPAAEGKKELATQLEFLPIDAATSRGAHTARKKQKTNRQPRRVSSSEQTAGSREKPFVTRQAPRLSSSTDAPSIPFGAWMTRQWRRDDNVGDLVRTFHNEADDSRPEWWQAQLEAVRARRALFDGLRRAVREWKTECKEKAPSGTVPPSASSDQSYYGGHNG